ncbi:MAG: CAP domain-containing protein [Actinobacteria bacterium]|nr:CAP domain-containing protein [Actinomycetota bacterium]
MAGAAGFASPVSATSPTYVGLVPARLLDTRVGASTVDGQFVGGGQVGPAAQLDVAVLGRGGVPTSGVAAVALNLTVVSPTASSFVTVYPTGAQRPNASNVNFVAGQTVANMVIVPVGAAGQISLFNEAGSAHLIVDVLGWFATGAGYTGFAPARLLDTRAGTATVDGQFLSVGSVGSASDLVLTVLGRGGVPPSGVAAVVLNVTVAAPTADSYLTVYPTGTARPNASTLNFTAGQTIANMVIAPVGVGGWISLFHESGSTHLIVDVLGWFAVGADYTGFAPARLLDTRPGTATTDGLHRASEFVGQNCMIDLPVLGRGGVPASGVGAVTVNVTVTQPSTGSFVTAYPSGSPRPISSNLNFAGGRTVANLVVVPVGSNGRISLYNYTGQAQVIVDVLGWFAGSPLAGSPPNADAPLNVGCQPSVSEVAAECTALTNFHRAQASLAPLTVSATLNAAAVGHSTSQASIMRMTHDSADGAGPGTRMTNAGYVWRTWGENVAYGQSDCATVIAAWMASPGHRANILNPAFTEIGIAVAVGPNGYKYWTMDLAAPR